MIPLTARERLVKITTWSGLTLALLAWMVSIAIEAPWTPWLTIALWAAIGVGMVVRILTKRRKTTSLDAFQRVNEIYQGRTQSPYVERSVTENSQFGEPFPEPRTPSPKDRAE